MTVNKTRLCHWLFILLLFYVTSLLCFIMSFLSIVTCHTALCLATDCSLHIVNDDCLPLKKKSAVNQKPQALNFLSLQQWCAPTSHVPSAHSLLFFCKCLRHTGCICLFYSHVLCNCPVGSKWLKIAYTHLISDAVTWATVNLFKVAFECNWESASWCWNKCI